MQTPRYRLETLKASDNPKKKYTAVFRKEGTNQTKTIHFGAAGYMDYPSWYTERGKEYADMRKEAYLKRHAGMGEDYTNPVSAGALAKFILWNKPTLAESIKDFRNRFDV
jgi:hypothetical protein